MFSNIQRCLAQISSNMKFVNRKYILKSQSQWRWNTTNALKNQSQETHQDISHNPNTFNDVEIQNWWYQYSSS